MGQNEQDYIESTNDAEETVNPEEVEEVEEDDELELLRLEKERLEKENKSLKFQKQKFKDKAKEVISSAPANTKSDELSTKDIYALMQANVPEDDIDEVVEYAKLKGISVKDALGSNVVKSILRDNAEQRQIADASNVGPSKRGSNKASDDALLANASKGKFPENDADLRRLIELQKKRK